MAEQRSGGESRLAYSLHQFLWNSPDYLVSITHTQRGDHCAERRQSKNKGASVFVALWRLIAPTAMRSLVQDEGLHPRFFPDAALTDTGIEYIAIEDFAAIYNFELKEQL
jgi:hypothetical protein